MGIGYGYRCRKCKNKYDVYLGVGMCFSSRYRKLMEEILNGKFGTEIKETVKSQKQVVVNADAAVYICCRCIKWKTERVLDVYVPKNTDKISGNEKVSEWVSLDYVKYEDYRLLKKFIHRCPDCGTPTHRVEDKEFQNLPCPRCKTKNNVTSFINWD